MVGIPDSTIVIGDDCMSVDGCFIGEVINSCVAWVNDDSRLVLWITVLNKGNSDGVRLMLLGGKLVNIGEDGITGMVVS